MVLKSPYQWFGGKSKVADLVWDRFGDVRNSVEPFFGSGAVLLRRPEPFEGTETVNDLDGMVSNFWRALQAVPDEVAKWADWPVNECDLHARHLWLVTEGVKNVERLKSEPDYFNAKVAGWWVWGLCQWIGSGWCAGKSSWGGEFKDGKLCHERLPHLGRARGVHRPHQKLPHLGDAGRGINSERGGDIYSYFELLSQRMRRVRVCCGDWSRVCGPTPTVKQGLTAVFLDPPYSHAMRDDSIYSEDHDVSSEVREWCLERGSDKLLRVALCGYAGEGHEELEEHGWDCVHWKAGGGYASQNADEGTRGKANAGLERIWFSPGCIKERTLF